MSFLLEVARYTCTWQTVLGTVVMLCAFEAMHRRNQRRQH